MTGQLALHVGPNTPPRPAEGEGAGANVPPAPSQARFRPTRRRLASGRIVFLHPCCKCGARAPFGYGCNLLVEPPKPGDWYCVGCRP